MCLNIYQPISFKPGMVLETAKLYSLISVWVTLTFIQRSQIYTNKSAVMANFSVNLDEIQYAVHCCSEPVKSAHLWCRLAYPPPADPDTLAPAMSESVLSVPCSPSLLSIKMRVFCSNFLWGRVFISDFVWEWYSPHDWRLSFIMLCH